MEPTIPFAKSLINQVDKTFTPTYGDKPTYANWAASNSLFAFFIGNNDVMQSYEDTDTSRIDRIFMVYADLLEIVSLD
jgi:hypothetical protein